jgi:aspartyl/asparaginyl beta-hydroxylase (cupin superfamily)
MAGTDSTTLELLQRAERARAEGRPADAEQSLQQARAQAPGDPNVLYASGVQALHMGQAADARGYLERAAELDAANPSVWLNLATAYRNLRLLDEEAGALERALALEPRHTLALLQKGSLHELQGRPRAAATVYQRALAMIPPRAEIPEGLKAAIQRAAAVVRQNASELDAFLAGRLQPVRERLDGAKFARFDHCVDALLGKRRIYHSTPAFLHFPALPACEFYDRDEFPWLDAFEAAVPEIGAEFERLRAADAALPGADADYPASVSLQQQARLRHAVRHRSLFLLREGERIEANLARCPTVARLLPTAPQYDVPGHGPTAYFSMLEARTRVPPYTGATNTRLTVHLPLVAQPGCRFRVGSETRAWQPGKAWVFDETIEHEAANDSDAPQAILVFDIWNPYLTAAERDLVRAAVQGIREYYRAEVGG